MTVQGTRRHVRGCRPRGLVAVLLLCIVSDVSGAVAQGAQELAALTVPAGRLAPGCALAPIELRVASPGNGATVRIVAPGTPPTNPWSGEDPALVGHIRGRMDGPLSLPDGPPLDEGATNALRERWNRHVIDAYWARYAALDAPPVDVLAVRYDDASRAQPSPLSDVTRPSRDVSTRLARGATVVVVRSSSADGCYRAIVEYLRTLP